MNNGIKKRKFEIFLENKKNHHMNDVINSNFPQENISKILIIKWGAMGDVILASAIINDILDYFDRSIIDINTFPPWQKFFKHDSRINKVWGFNFPKSLKKYLLFFKWLSIVKSEKYDLVIDLQTNDKSRILLSILRFLLKFRAHLVGNHNFLPYTIRSKSTQVIENPFSLMQQTLCLIGIKPRTFFPSIKVSKNSSEKINKLIKDTKLVEKKFIIFIPGSSNSNLLKRWGYKNFHKLSILLNDMNKDVVLIGGPDDLDECKKIKKLNKKVINLCSKLEIIDLIPFFDKAEYVIGNDTGPAHLVACTKTPLIQITGPTNPIKVKPNGKQIISIQSNLPCINCYKKLCSHHKCMNEVNASDIFNLIYKKL